MSHPKGNPLSIEERGEYLWVNLPEDITMDNYRSIEDAIHNRLTGKRDRLVLDFSKTQHIYSSGIGILIRIKKTISETDGVFCLVNVSKKIRDILKEIHLNKILPIYATDVEFEISSEDMWQKKIKESGESFSFNSQSDGPICNCIFTGHMDAIHDLSHVSEYKPSEEVLHYILNFENLDIMDTYGSQVLLEFIDKLRKNRADCYCFGANDMINELLTMLSITDFLTLCGSESEAKKMIEQS